MNVISEGAGITS